MALKRSTVIDGGKTPLDRGAVRGAAIEKQRFEITDFVSEREIVEHPQILARTFPGPVCETIKSKLPR
jgi:hypothetical protein